MVEIPRLVNFRDFENYSAKNGERLRGGVFARSDNPFSLTKEDIALLRNRGFTVDIDLRRDNELALFPDQLAAEEGFSYHHIVLNDDPYCDFGPLDSPRHIAEAYYSKLEVSAHRIAEIFHIFAAADSGVLFHCESGKDRTGTVAALLLLLNDVPDDVILWDYDLSSKRLTADMAEPWKYDPLLMPVAENMACFLELFHEEYAVPADYFHKIGITEKEMDRIIGKFRKGIN